MNIRKILVGICILSMMVVSPIGKLYTSAGDIDGGILYKTTYDNTKVAYVYIGDSRTVGMNKAVKLDEKEDTFVVAKSGMGYNWFMQTGSEEVYKIRESHPEYTKWVYIFNLGVNDLSNIGNYLTLYRDLSAEKDTVVYYLSINPTDDSVGGIQCKDIEDFNKRIYTVAYDDYINGYQYLIDVAGFTFDKRQDGMHYSDETYQKLYEFIDMSVKVREFVEENNGRYSAFYYLYNTTNHQLVAH